MKTLATGALALSLALAGATACLAQPVFPARPITIVVPAAPGGDADTLARILAPALRQVWKQPVNVQNVPDEGGAVAADRVARSPWDAYTLLLAPTATIGDSKVRYFAPVALVATSPLAIVAASKSRIANVADLAKHARARPGKLAYGEAGDRRAVGLAGELFRSVAGVDIRRVRFDTAAEALAGVLAGKVDFAFVPLRDALPQLAGGKLKALAVTGLARATALPAVPTVAESGYAGFEAVEWYGLMLPIATPLPFVTIHNADANKALALPEVRAKIVAAGLEPGGGPSGRLFNLIQMDWNQWPTLGNAATGKPATGKPATGKP